METIVFASNNAHKLQEIRNILGNHFEVKSLHDIGCEVDIPETGLTFEENALQKAQYVKTHYGLDCFADDSGMEVEALGGEPGIYSARYAKMHGREVTPETRDDINMDVSTRNMAPWLVHAYSPRLSSAHVSLYSTREKRITSMES